MKLVAKEIDLALDILICSNCHKTFIIDRKLMLEVWKFVEDSEKYHRATLKFYSDEIRCCAETSLGWGTLYKIKEEVEEGGGDKQ